MKYLFLITFLFISIIVYGQDVLVYEENGKYGLKSSGSNKIIISPKYDLISPGTYQLFEEGLAAVKLNGKWGFITENGIEIIPVKYEDVGSFSSDGFAPVKLNGKLGFIDKKGHEISPIKYDGVANFFQGVAAVELNGKLGFIDKRGLEILPIKYERADFEWENKVFIVQLQSEGQVGMIDITNKEIIPPKYDRIDPLGKGLFKVSKYGKWGIINEQGKELGLIKYDKISFFDGDLAKVSLDGKWGLIDKTGKEIAKLKYDSIVYPYGIENAVHSMILKLSGGKKVARVLYNDKWSFIDSRGNDAVFTEEDRKDFEKRFNKY